jgi:hypothetical protein
VDDEEGNQQAIFVEAVEQLKQILKVQCDWAQHFTSRENLMESFG